MVRLPEPMKMKGQSFNGCGADAIRPKTFLTSTRQSPKPPGPVGVDAAEELVVLLEKGAGVGLVHRDEKHPNTLRAVLNVARQRGQVCIELYEQPR